MSIKVFLYWVLFFGITVWGVVYGWPGETPTYRVPIWLPQAPSNTSLAVEWLQKPGEKMLPETFKEKVFKESWSFTTPLTYIDSEPEGEPQKLIQLGKDGYRQIIFYTNRHIGGPFGIMPWPESWLRPIWVQSAEIDPTGFLVIKTRPDYWYPVKSGLIAMILSLCLIWFLYERMGTASRFIVRFPWTYLPPVPQPAAEGKQEKAPTTEGAAPTPTASSSPPPKAKRGKKIKKRSGGAGIA